MKIKRLISLILVLIICASFAGCNSKEYTLAKDIFNILERDQIIEVFGKADVSDKFMSELEKEYDADYLTAVSDILTEGVFAQITMDNYNGEYEVQLFRGNTDDKPITTIMSVKSGVFVNIRQLSDYLRQYSIYKDACVELDKIMNGSDYIRYNYFTNLDRYEYNRLTGLVEEIMKTLNSCIGPCFTVSSIKDTKSFKVTPELESKITSSVQQALVKKDVVTKVRRNIEQYLRYCNLDDLRVVFNDEKLVKKDLENDLSKYMSDLNKDLRDNYEKYISDLFDFNDYWEFVFTDATYYSDVDSMRDEDELARIDIYNYTNGSRNGKDIPQYGNKDCIVDIQVVFRKLKGSSDSYDDYYGNSNRLKKLIKSPSGALSADIVGENIKKAIEDVDISNRYDGIELDVDLNGYSLITDISQKDKEVYKNEKLLPLRNVGEALGMTIGWNTNTSTPTMLYKALSGNYVQKNDVSFKLIDGTSYVTKGTFEQILGYDIYVIDNKVYGDNNKQLNNKSKK